MIIVVNGNPTSGFAATLKGSESVLFRAEDERDLAQQMLALFSKEEQCATIS